MTGMPTAAVGAALLVFLWVGLRARTADTTLNAYLTARGSQSALTLGLSFLASGLGAWILFVPPEIGAFVGPVALAGYAIGAALPFRVLAWCGPAIRRLLPAGRSLTDNAGQRFGPLLRVWILGLSLLYMLCFLTAELTALGAIVGLLTGADGRWAVLAAARGITVALMVPVVAVAWEGLSVLRLFLIADLLCATAVVPLLLGLWPRASTGAALAGSVAGLIGAVLPSALASGSLTQGLLAATFPTGVPTLAPFAGALLASSLVCGLWIWLRPARP